MATRTKGTFRGTLNKIGIKEQQTFYIDLVALWGLHVALGLEYC